MTYFLLGLLLLIATIIALQLLSRSQTFDWLKANGFEITSERPKLASNDLNKVPVYTNKLFFLNFLVNWKGIYKNIPLSVHYYSMDSFGHSNIFAEIPGQYTIDSIKIYSRNPFSPKTIDKIWQQINTTPELEKEFVVYAADGKKPDWIHNPDIVYKLLELRKSCKFDITVNQGILKFSLNNSKQFSKNKIVDLLEKTLVVKDIFNKQ